MAKAPDYHFLYLPAALSADWLFDAAQHYWERFRPIVISALDLIDHLPRGKRTVLTVLMRRDLAPTVLAEVKKRFPRLELDPLVYDVVRDLKLTLDGRAEFGQRFGLLEESS
ncbi:MAG TPA: hypothetical protein PLD47_03190 [Aggregatilineales bacterium]|nr:hypothetical protein [Anaerolineales bacterium]HRE46705.1 hypothetical protein [Aggregatilineales bacterium]